MTTTAAISYGRDSGYQVRLTEIPLGWLAAGTAGELASVLTGHVLCCNLPEWPHAVRWGRADEDGWSERSLGHLMYRAGQWLNTITFRHEQQVAAIEVTPEWVQEHFPDFRDSTRFLEDGPDAMSVTFG